MPRSFRPFMSTPAMQCVAALLILCIALVASEEPQPTARLLASKQVLNQYLVQKKDLTIHYTIHNVGDSPAYDVNLVENNFAQGQSRTSDLPAHVCRQTLLNLCSSSVGDFDFLGGFTKMHWDSIPAHSNVSSSLVLQPTKFGYFNFSSATVTYRAGQEAATPLIHGWTSAPGEGHILEMSQFNRQFSSHVADWLTFLIMAVPTVGIPYFLWYRSKVRFTETGLKAKKL